MDGDLKGWGEQYICTAAAYYPILIQPLSESWWSAGEIVLWEWFFISSSTWTDNVWSFILRREWENTVNVKYRKLQLVIFILFSLSFFVCFCRHENMGKLFNWRFLDINTETKTQHLDALFLLQSSSFAILFIAYRQNCGSWIFVSNVTHEWWDTFFPLDYY